MARVLDDKCSVCGKQLEPWFYGEICSPKCRKKKSRDRLEAPKRASTIAWDIDKITVSISKGYFTKEEAESMLYEINARLWAMRDAINQIGMKTERIQGDSDDE